MANRQRKISRSIDLSSLILDGDLVAKASHIVILSSEDGSDQGFYSVEHYVEHSLRATVKNFEESHGEIKLTPNGLSVIPKSEYSN
jgi:hypothetical protein